MQHSLIPTLTSVQYFVPTLLSTNTNYCQHYSALRSSQLWALSTTPLLHAAEWPKSGFSDHGVLAAAAATAITAADEAVSVAAEVRRRRDGSIRTIDSCPHVPDTLKLMPHYRNYLNKIQRTSV